MNHLARLRTALRNKVASAILAAALGSALATGSAKAASSDWAGDARAGIRLVASTDAAGPDGRTEAGLQFRLAAGWHTYWRSPGEVGFPPQIDWSGSENVKDVAVAWPAPARLSASGLRSNVYRGEVVLPVAVTAVEPGAPIRLRARVEYAGCREICIPYRATLSLDLPAGQPTASPEAALIAEARSRVPAAPESAGFQVAAARWTEAASGAALTAMLTRTTGRFTAPEIFVEAEGRDEPASTIRVTEDGRTAWLKVSLPAGTGPPAGTRERLDFTLVDGDRSAAWTVP